MNHFIQEIVEKEEDEDEDLDLYTSKYREEV